MTAQSASRLQIKKFPALDDFRLLAVILVVANHTRSADSEVLWLLTVLRRVSVPYFMMVSGYFLARGSWRSTGKFLKRTAALYGVGVLLYLPLNDYAGQLSPDFIRRVIFDGSFYHLWYLPALLLGTPIAYYLSRFKPRAAIPIAGALYLIGLGGESCYGLVSGVSLLSAFYNGIFRVFDYTRNGLFYAVESFPFPLYGNGQPAHRLAVSISFAIRFSPSTHHPGVFACPAVKSILMASIHGLRPCICALCEAAALTLTCQGPLRRFAAVPAPSPERYTRFASAPFRRGLN